MTKKKRILQKCYTLHPRADGNINGVLVCGGFIKSLFPDRLIRVTTDLASYRCVNLSKTLPRQGLDSVDEVFFYIFFLILHMAVLDLNVIYSSQIA